MFLKFFDFTDRFHKKGVTNDTKPQKNIYNSIFSLIVEKKFIHFYIK